MNRASFLPVLIASALLVSCGDEQAQQMQVTPTAVRVQLVKPTDVTVTKTYTGTLEGEEHAVVFARVSEVVEEVLVAQGDRVTKGQILVRLNKSGPGSRYQEAQSIYRNAEKHFNKMEDLYKEGAVSESEYDAARTEYEVARADFASAAELVEIASPINGVVTALKVDKGDFVVVGKELLTVATTGNLRVKFGVNPEDIQFVRVGSPVTIAVGAATSSVTGGVRSVAHSADPVTKKFRVDATLDSEQGRIKPGEFARITVKVEQLTDVLSVPTAALLERENGLAVFVVADGIGLERPVTVTRDLGDRVIIESGVKSGDSLVVVGQQYLEDGRPVNVVDVVTAER